MTKVLSYNVVVTVFSTSLGSASDIEEDGLGQEHNQYLCQVISKSRRNSGLLLCPTGNPLVRTLHSWKCLHRLLPLDNCWIVR